MTYNKEIHFVFSSIRLSTSGCTVATQPARPPGSPSQGCEAASSMASAG